MGSACSQASEFLVWLGLAGDSGRLAFDFMTSMSQGPSPGRRNEKELEPPPPPFF
jgi:hypothetical protein